jgi:hypothetical protein
MTQYQQLLSHMCGVTMIIFLDQVLLLSFDSSIHLDFACLTAFLSRILDL